MRRSNGFTLIELLVVIAIIGILVALLIPAVQSVRETARKTACQNNLRQIGEGLHLHLSARRAFPPAATVGPPVHNWLAYLLKFIEQENIYRDYDMQLDWFHVDNQSAITTPIPLLICPSSPAEALRQDEFMPGMFAAVSDYAPVSSVAPVVYDEGYAPPVTNPNGSIAFDDWVKVKDIRDGLSTTIMITECAGRPFHYIRGGLGPDDHNPGGGNLPVIAGRAEGSGWADTFNAIPLHGFTHDGLASPGPYPVNSTNNNEAFSFHSAGIVCLFSDGSVRFLSENIDIRTYAELTTRDGGEVVSGEF